MYSCVSKVTNSLNFDVEENKLVIILQSYAAFPLSLTERNSQIPGCKFSQQRKRFLK